MWSSRWIAVLFSAADLMRQIDAPVVCHFVREEVRDVEDSGRARREVYFGSEPELKGRDVLVVDAVLESGVTQEFLLRRLGESKPRSIRLAVLLDKPAKRRVALEPDYLASEPHLIKYGLAMALRHQTGWGAISGSFLPERMDAQEKWQGTEDIG